MVASTEVRVEFSEDEARFNFNINGNYLMVLPQTLALLWLTRLRGIQLYHLSHQLEKQNLMH